MDIHGTVAPGFEAVRDVFEENFRIRGELGAAACVYVDGEQVVDLWGGQTDRGSAPPWQPDTIGLLFSATKGLAATAFLQAHERGLFSYEQPVVDFWPEFGQANKQDVTIEMLLSHRAGVCGLDQPITLDDLENWMIVEEAAAAQEPMWEPGTAQGYHGVTYGIYASALFKRITGETIGTWLQRELCGPLGAEVWLGLPEEYDSRVATMHRITPATVLTKVVPAALLGRPPEGLIYRAFTNSASDTARAFGNPKELGARGILNFNQPRVRRMELAWANAFGTARGLARVYGALSNGGEIDGIRVVRRESLDRVIPRVSFEQDRVLHKPMGFSNGFVKEQNGLFSPNDEAFGHPGAGGILGWADPVAGVGIGYVMNQMDYRLRSPRAIELCGAVYRCLEAR